VQCARCFHSKRREREKKEETKEMMKKHLGIKPQAHRSGCFPWPKWSIFNKRYQLDERDLCQPESQLQPIFAIPFCQELPFQQKGYQIKSIQTKNPKHRTLQQVVLGTLRFQRTRQNKSIIKSNQHTIYNRLWMPRSVGKLWFERMSSERKVKKDFWRSLHANQKHGWGSLQSEMPMSVED